MKLNIENTELLRFSTDTVTIEILGGIKLTGLDRLRTTLKIVHLTNHALRNTVDLYNSDQVEKLIRRVADHFELEVQQMRTITMALIEQLEAYRIEQNKAYYAPKRKKIELTTEEEKQAVKDLKDKKLIESTLVRLGKAGIIGEEINRLLMYLVFTSRKLNNPLHIITLGPSGVGKSHLQQTVAELIPEEDKIEITTLTKNSLYYFDTEELQHTLIAIEDLDGTTEESMYAIRELQSKKQLSKTIAKKDSKGNTKTETVLVKGIVTIAGTTTKNIYEDNSNRSILIQVDTSEEQDQKIINYQKRLAAGEVDKQEVSDIRLHFKRLQRALKPMKVINPLTEDLNLPDSLYTPRRTMAIYLSLIEVITYYHQYQRPQKKNEQGQVYIETTKEDIQWANLLLKDVFLRKSDELSGGARSFLEALRAYLKDKKLFTTKEIKKAFKVNPTSLKRYLKELEDTQLLQVRGNRYRGYEYRLQEDDFKEIQAAIERFSSPQVVTS